MTQKVETADTCKVAEEYVSKGKELKEKFILNLDAKDIMAKFRDYPIREYPVVEEGSLMGRILRKKVLMENKA